MKTEVSGSERMNWVFKNIFENKRQQKEYVLDFLSVRWIDDSKK